MKIDLKSFRVKEGADISLADFSTKVQKSYGSKGEYEKQLGNKRREAHDLQDRMFAHNQYGVVIILHGMDGAGKGGIIEHVIGGINPIGLDVTPFKVPSERELGHDFLWRHMPHLPERGEVAVFDRSYYEEVVVVRVHPEFLDKQNIPEEHRGKGFWKGRFESIRDHEEHLHRNGFRVIKLFLHISPEEQARQLIERIDERDKNFKASVRDLDERKLRGKYDRYWAEAISRTSTEHCPWYIIPADDRENARLIAAEIITRHLAKLPTEYPALSKTDRTELEKRKAELLVELGEKGSTGKGGKGKKKG